MPFDTYRSTQDPNIFIARYFKNENGPFYFYKYCTSQSNKDKYAAAFQREYVHMNRLYLLMCAEGHETTYKQLFPVYHSAHFSPKSKLPYIAMEYVEGQTLEDYLSSLSAKSNYPVLQLSNQQLLHLFDQLHEASRWLLKAGMIQIDLHPQNIMILNDNFDIKLIDFTDCYYTDSFDQNYHAIDRQINRDQPIGLQLCDACFSLFTRLFYCGHEHYSDNYNYSYFLHHYHRLITRSCPTNHSSQSNNTLEYFAHWYRILCDIYR